MLMRREKNIIFHLGKLRSYSKCDNDNITHIYKLDKNTAIAMHRLRLSNTPEIRTEHNLFTCILGILFSVAIFFGLDCNEMQM